MTTEDPQAANREAYRAAYEDWQRKLERIHSFFLDGKRVPPQEIKGMLNQEARAKERYDDARRRLLGIEDDEE